MFCLFSTKSSKEGEKYSESNHMCSHTVFVVYLNTSKSFNLLIYRHNFLEKIGGFSESLRDLDIAYDRFIERAKTCRQGKIVSIPKNFRINFVHEFYSLFKSYLQDVLE